MRIEEIDKNLRVECNITEPDILWFDCREAPFSVHGLLYDAGQGCFVRLPQEVADAVSPGVAHLSHNTAGGRVRFRTDSPYIAIRAVMKNEYMMPHMTRAGMSGFDLYRRLTKEESPFYTGTFMPPVAMQTGYAAARWTDGKMAEYTINFPLYDCVDALYIALKKGAHIEAPWPYRYERPVVYYGSSITQGGCASRPGNSYQALISRRYDLDYINLGFSGSARAEESMVAYLASLSMQAFVCDYDHNTPNAAHLQNTHLPLYRAIRAAHPDLPILLVSAPDVYLDPVTYGPRRDIIRATYETAVAEGDTHIAFLDGGTLFAGMDADACTVDTCHPNDLGFFRMAEKIGAALTSLL